MKKKSRIKKFLDKNPKLRNPYFYISVIGLIFSAAGVDFNSLTSWSLLGKALLDILNNPVSTLAVITALTGIWMDNGDYTLKSKKQNNGDYTPKSKKQNKSTQKPKDKL